MQPQPDLYHPVLQRGQHLAGLALADTVHHRVIDLCRPADYADRRVKVLVSDERWVEWSA
jgi:hypothetical protein